MASKFYNEKPLEAFEYKKDDDALKEELALFGIEFNDEGTEVTTNGGNPQKINDGDYIVLNDDYSVTAHSADYFKQNLIEFGTTPTATEPKPGAGEPANPPGQEGGGIDGEKPEGETPPLGETEGQTPTQHPERLTKEEAEKRKKEDEDHKRAEDLRTKDILEKNKNLHPDSKIREDKPEPGKPLDNKVPLAQKK